MAKWNMQLPPPLGKSIETLKRIADENPAIVKAIKPRCTFEEIEAQIVAFEAAVSDVCDERRRYFADVSVNKDVVDDAERKVEDERATLLAMIKELHQ